MPVDVIGGGGGGPITELDPVFLAWLATDPFQEYALSSAVPTKTSDLTNDSLLSKSGGALTGQLTPTTTAQVRNIALVSVEPSVESMVEGTIYFVYEGV